MVTRKAPGSRPPEKEQEADSESDYAAPLLDSQDSGDSENEYADEDDDIFFGTNDEAEVVVEGSSDDEKNPELVEFRRNLRATANQQRDEPVSPTVALPITATPSNNPPPPQIVFPTPFYSTHIRSMMI